MILLFTDFGAQGPYLGQMEAVLRGAVPQVPVINLLSDAPMGDPRRSAYLLAALARSFPEGCVFLAVVDPGVGGERWPVALKADGRWFVGPDNGLFNTVALASTATEWRRIAWRPAAMSASFHGRDLFAPVAARLAQGDLSWADPAPWGGPDLAAWASDLAEVIYIDHYGNAITGLRYGAELDGRVLRAGGLELRQAETFCSVAESDAFWYCNSMGLVEVAVNRGRADQHLGLALGAALDFA